MNPRITCAREKFDVYTLKCIFLHHSSNFSFQVEAPPTKDSAQRSHLSIPDISGNILYILVFHNITGGPCHMFSVLSPFHCLLEEEWSKLLELSPLFQMLKELQLQLEGGGTALLRGGKPTSTSCRKSLLPNILLIRENKGLLLLLIQVEAADS